MWESWSLRKYTNNPHRNVISRDAYDAEIVCVVAAGSKGAAFGPATRGPFPLYACYDATITTSSGAMLICGRFPALSCQLSFDSGMTWKMSVV